MRFVVVGAGPAGCVFAAAVAPDHDVVIVEAGDRHGPDPGILRPLPTADDRIARIPVTRSRLTRRATEAGARPDPAAGDGYICGRGVGGGSLVNGGFVVGEPPSEVAGLLPFERPGAIGPMAAALLGSHDGAEVGSLVAVAGRRVDLAAHLIAPHDSIELITHRPVVRIVVEGGRAVGVQTEDGGHVGGDVVVVCAGALTTPTLLLRSGVDAPGIGDRLHDTTSVPITVELDDPAAAAGVAPLVASAERSRHRLTTVERAVDPRFGVLLVSLTATSARGRLTLPDPDGPPVIELGQLADDEDRRALATAVRDAAATLRHPAWRTVARGASIDDHGTALDTLGDDVDDIARWASARLGGTYHATATCSLACDRRGAVRGHAGLVVADASLLPATPARNPFLAVVAQAHRLGAGWRGSPRPPDV